MQTLSMVSYRMKANTKTIALPFPGKFPTRWRIRIREAAGNKKPLLTYDGKPNRLVAQRVLAFIYHPGANLWWDEFDRGSIVREFNVALPRFITAPTGVNPALERLYYGVSELEMFSPWIIEFPRIVRMNFFGHEWVSYLPKTGFTELNLKEYAKWVRDTKFQWKRPISARSSKIQ